MQFSLHLKPASTLLAATLSLLIGGQVCSVFAQDGLRIEEIVITATKRPESLQDVSVSVSTLSSFFMQDASISDMNDVSQHIPALTVTTNSSPWNTSFRMRRMGNDGNIPTFEPDTGLFIDGAFRSRSGLGLGDLVDIERIEALKGPQSTLYGKNVTAGVVSVTTTRPSQTLSSMVEVSAAENSAYNFKGYVNGGLSETLSGRLSLSYSERDHLIDNQGNGGDANNQQRYSLRGQLLVEPSEALSIRLIAGKVERDIDGPVGDVNWGATALAVFAAAGTPVKDNTMGNRKIDYAGGITEFEQDSYDVTTIVEYDLGGPILTSITSFDTYDVSNHFVNVTQSPIKVASFDDSTDGDSWSQELRLSSAAVKSIDWMTGIFLYHNHFTRGDGTHQDFLLGSEIQTLSAIAFAPTLGGLAPIALGAPGQTGDFYNEQDTDTYSVFASATWNLSGKLSLSGGFRYSFEEKEAELSTRGNGTGAGVGPLPNGLIGAITPTNSWKPSDDWNALTGNLSVKYQWSEDVMTYGSIAHGFKAGGFNLGFGTGANTDRPFDEETVDSLELGWKTQLLENRLQFNGALFYTEYTDFQSAAFLGLQFNVNNAEQVNNSGIEFDILYLLSENLTANVAVSYVKAKYDQYTRGSCAPGVSPNGPAASLGFCDLSGEDLPYAPRWKANAGIQYQRELIGGELYARTDIAWVDDHFSSASLDPRHQQSDYTLANAKLGWRNDSWDFSLWGKNIGNQDYSIQSGPDNILGVLFQDASQQMFINPPRSIGVTARFIY